MNQRKVVPLDQDHVSPVDTGTGPNPLAHLVEETMPGPVDATIGIEVPKGQDAQPPVEMAALHLPRTPRELLQFAKSFEDVATVLLPILNEPFLKGWQGMMPSIVRGIMEAEAIRRQAFCTMVVQVVNDLNQVPSRKKGKKSLTIEIIAEDGSRLKGEMLEFKEREGMCVVDVLGNDKHATFTCEVPLRNILCVALSIPEDEAVAYWRYISGKLEQQFALQEREKSVHGRFRALRELMAADAHEGGGQKTHVRFQLKGGSVLEGEVMAIDRCGCLVAVRSSEDIEGVEVMSCFIPYESIAVHGFLSERYDDLEVSDAKRRGEPIPVRIQLKRQQRELQQLDMGHDPEYFPKA